jgi:hypothetical protein
MKRFTLVLTGLLAVQIALASVLLFSGPNDEAFKAEEPLLAFEKEKVDQIAIDETGGSSVTLKKVDGKWLIPGMAKFPADQQRVAGLLDKLAGLKKGWPVATTSEAAERFKVTEANHVRQIVLKSGEDEAGTMLIGTSPTYRQANVRAADGNEIYGVTIAAHDAGARGEDWMDRNVLNVAQDKIASIALGDVTLERKGGKFQLAGLGPEEKVKQVEIPPIVSAVASPSFDAVQGKGEAALAKLAPADIEVTVKRTEGEPIVYKYKKEEGGGAYLFASSAQPYLFRVSEATIKPLADASRAKLIEAKAEEKPEEKKPEDKPAAAAPQLSDQKQPGG